jgi:hypothetical protein
MSNSHEAPKKTNAEETAAVEGKISSLRKVAESGELGDAFLEGVAGGEQLQHIDDIWHIDSVDSNNE